MSEVPPVTALPEEIKQPLPDSYAPIWRIDPEIIRLTKDEGAALLFDTLITFAQSNENQELAKLRHADGRWMVRISRRSLKKIYDYLTLAQIRYRLDRLQKVGLIQKIEDDESGTPIYAITIRSSGDKNSTGGDKNSTPYEKKDTHSLSLSCSTSKSESEKTSCSTQSLQQTTVSSDDDGKAEQVKGGFVANASFPDKNQPVTANPTHAQPEDLPGLSDPLFSQHRRIAEDAFDRLAQTPGALAIRKLMQTLSECQESWALDDMERLLPQIIQTAHDRGKPIGSLSGFLRYKGRDAAASHPFGRAIAGERPIPKSTPEPVAETHNGGSRQSPEPEPKKPFESVFDHEGFFADRQPGYRANRRRGNSSTLTQEQKEQYSANVREQSKIMLARVLSETIP